MREDFLQIFSQKPSPADLSRWGLECGILFAFVAILFVWTALRRHRMDVALGAHGQQSARLKAPERLWTYDHAYIVGFLETLCRRAPANEVPSYWLHYYSGPILVIDIVFAISFAAFIVCGSLLIALALGPSPWLLRFSFVTAAMGVAYGFADVAEDLKLQSILRNAASVYAGRQTAAGDDPNYQETDIADAAEVDSANVLTRIKIATIALSLVGLVSFIVLQGLAALAVASVGNTSGGMRPAPQG